MKLFILVATILATAAASWEPIQEKYHGPLHYPKIHKGVPVEPAAVQHDREAHLKALSHASHDHHEHDYEHHGHDDHQESSHKWHGPLHYPKIHKGVPVEPKEVQHAREAHLSALAHASHDDNHYEHNHGDHSGYDHSDGHYEEEHQKKWHGPLHYPKIHKGVPVEPKEVQHAREAHLNALSHASSNGHYDHSSNNHHYRKRRGASSYVNFSNKVEHEVPVYHHEDLSHTSHKHEDHVYEHHNQESGHKWHGPLHYPKIYKGVPVEPKEVQHAREAHLSALAHASHDDHHYEHKHENNHNEYDHNDGHYEEEHQKKWHGPLHYPKIHKGVPVEPKEVQHAREAHLSALAHASHDDHHYEHNHDDHSEYNHNDGRYEEEHQKKWHGPLHYPKIHKGVPVEPKEVQHAREAHLNALSHASHHTQNNQHYRKRRGASSYVHFSSKIENEVPVYHHEDKTMMANEHEHQAYHHGNSHEFSYKQTHAPIYGHHEEDKHLGNEGHSYEHALVYGKHHYGNEGYSYEQVHAPVYGHYEEHKLEEYSPIYEHHVPVIGHDGTPMDTPEVQHAKEAHFAAHAATKLNNY